MQYVPVETVGSPDAPPAPLQLPPPPYGAVASLSVLSVQEDAAHASGHGDRSQRQQRKRKQVRARFNDLARSRNWHHCQKILFVLGLLGAAVLASFIVLRIIRTDEFNHMIEWIQVRQQWAFLGTV